MKETKTRTSRRALSLPGFLVELLIEQLAQAPAWEYVFLGPHGTWLRRSVFRWSWFKLALKASGLDEDFRFHDLWHTATGPGSPRAPTPRRSRPASATQASPPPSTPTGICGPRWGLSSTRRSRPFSVKRACPGMDSHVCRLAQPGTSLLLSPEDPLVIYGRR